MISNSIITPRSGELNHISTEHITDALIRGFAMDDNKHIKILLAEDNIVNSKLAEKMISKLGYTTSLALNGEEVIDKIKAASEPFDIILMDLQMPVMDGIEATKWVKSNAKDYGQDPVVIALTANTLSEDRKKCQEVGMVDFIAKPLGFKQLEMALSKWSKKLAKAS